MKTGRKPAQDAINLDRERSTLSSHNKARTIIPQNGANCQLFPWPNYCSHLPAYPEFFSPPSHHKPRSSVITEILNKLMDSYFKPAHSLKTLQNHQKSRFQVKSSRRNAAIKLLQIMVYYVDDATGMIGRRLQDGNFEYLSLKKLAQLADLRFKRTKRAFKQIVDAGYISVTRQYLRNENGDIFALPSKKELTPKFFMELDIKGKIWESWFWLKNWKKKQLEKKEIKVNKRAARATVGLMSETLKHGVKNFKNRVAGIVKKIPSLSSKSDMVLQHEARLRQFAIELHNADSSRLISDYYKELIFKYPAPT